MRAIYVIERVALGTLVLSMPRTREP